MLGGLLAFLIRGVLLWLVVPVAALVWLFVGHSLRRRGVVFWQYVGWVDLYLIWFLQNTVLRPLYRRTLARPRVRDIPTTNHRVRYLDFG